MKAEKCVKFDDRLWVVVIIKVPQFVHTAAVDCAPNPICSAV